MESDIQKLPKILDASKTIIFTFPKLFLDQYEILKIRAKDPTRGSTSTARVHYSRVVVEVV